MIAQHTEHVDSIVSQRMIKEADAAEYRKALERMKSDCIRVHENIMQFINEAYDQVAISLAIQALEIVLHKLSFDKDCSSAISDAILKLSERRVLTMNNNDSRRD